MSEDPIKEINEKLTHLEPIELAEILAYVEAVFKRNANRESTAGDSND